jgi:2-(1,2-epoxy-1,2-dihydrophenyl)acetyl-CoA isomerase
VGDRRELDTGTQDVRAHVEDRVGVITLNRPERRNAFSGAMVAGLARLLEEMDADPGVGAVVLTGAGGAFSAGGDVKGFAAQGESAGSGDRGADGGGLGGDYDRAIHSQRLNQRATSGRLFSLPKPTLASLPGPAAGAGLSLALACDLRIAARTAFMTTAFANVGFAGDYGGTWFLSRLVGLAKAKELYFLSERVGAEEALRLGLVNWVVEPEELEARTMEIAGRLAHGPAVALLYMKENLNRAVNGELGDCMDLEVTHHVRSGLTADHREAARAFVEKRPPRFGGN